MKLRAVMITQGVSRIVAPLLNRSDVQWVGCIESAPRGFDPVQPRALSDRLRHRLAGWRGQLLEQVVRRRGIPYFLLHRGNNDQMCQWLADLKSDLVVVYSMSQLLPAQVLTVPRHGMINLHPSLLPAYRGPNPWFWMYYDGQRTGGVTLHYIDPGEDTGDIIDQRTFEITPGMKSRAMQDLAISDLGVSMIQQALTSLVQGRDLPRLAQPEQSPTVRARNLKPEEHRQMIDWQQWPIQRVWHLMRGTETWLNCIDMPTGLYAGHRWSVGAYESDAMAGRLAPGTVHRDQAGDFVACRDGRIRLHVRFRPRVFFSRCIQLIHGRSGRTSC